MLRERFTTRKISAKPAPRSRRQVPQSFMLRTGFVLSRIVQFMREDMDRELTPFGITCRHCGILGLLHEEGPQSQQELGEMLLIDRSTIVDLVDHLEKLKWVERAPDALDRRAYQVTITAKGKSTYESARKKLKATETELFAEISQADFVHFQETLVKIFTHQLGKRTQE